MIRCRGEVYLVGAGPGDPELITIKGMRLLRSADVVVHDRLIGNAILNECRDDAELIDVGKYPDHHRIRQHQINQLLVDRAEAELKVVRLKGGDPFVFGRGMEELEFCRRHNIECHVVPGISSAIAGPAAVGVPVTCRGIARSFAVITAQSDPNLPDHPIDFGALTEIDTVVFMMGRKNLDLIARSLIAAGRDAMTPVTCVQEATMPSQRTATGTLSSIADIVEAQQLANPMITIVGQVAALVNPDLLPNCCEIPVELPWRFHPDPNTWTSPDRRHFPARINGVKPV